MNGKHLFGVACKTCRRRGRKCDRRLPTCINCSLRGAECEGYALRWVNDTIDRETNILPTPALRSLSKVKTTKARTVAKSAHSGPVVQDTTSRDICVRQQQIRIDPIIPITARDDLEDLIRYYAHELNAAFTLGKDPVETPCSHQILPMTRAIPSIRCVVAATAACHLAHRLEDDELHRRSLHFRLQATELLRAELGSGPNEPDLARLLCMVLLAQLDVCSGDCVEFATHLQAARTFLRLCDTEDTERSFIEQRLAWLDVMDATTNPRLAHSTLEDIKRIINKFKAPSGERVWGQDVFPCPIDLFGHLADIVFLYESQPKHQHQYPTAHTLHRAISIGNAIDAWTASTASQARRHINEIWRTGILLYLIRLFRLPNDTFDTPILTDTIFQHARCLSLPAQSSYSHATTWPLFQAGLMLPTSSEDNHSDSNKTWLRNQLYKNFSTLGCAHQKIAGDVLGRVWQAKGEESAFGSVGTDLGMRKLILY